MLSKAEYRHFLSRDLTGFIERCFRDLNPQDNFVRGQYMEVMAAKLEACRQGKIRRLIINLPPRCLKSISASVAFTAWWLGHHPSARIISASYGQDLASKFARDTRSIMQSQWYGDLFATRLSDRKAVDDFDTTARGTRMATSVGGVITGRGADLIIIDDPQKPDETLSEVRRKTVNDWYDNSLVSRLNDKANGCIIIIMQRLHMDDLVGHVLGLEDWDVLSFPAIAEQDEAHPIESIFGTSTFRRRAGEALHPERDSLATLLQLRASMTEYNFSAQYQQNPMPVGGAMVKTAWLKYYVPGEEPANFSRIIQSWDTANKTTELSDFSVGTTWGALGDQYYLLHVFRKRLNYPDLKRTIVEMAARYNPDAIVIEDKASGTQLIQDLRADHLIGVKDYAPPPQTDKIMRLNSQTLAFENGHVWLPTEAPWLDDYVSELTSFPGSKFYDQVDSTAQALDYLRSNRNLDIWARLGA